MRSWTRAAWVATGLITRPTTPPAESTAMFGRTPSLLPFSMVTVSTPGLT